MLEYDPVTRMLENLAGRAGGPMHVRLLLQPTMALIFGIRDGIRDGRERRPAYLWALYAEPGRRSELLRHGWKSVGKIFVFAMILDAIYQFITVRWFYPGEALVVACTLALVPYLVIRGPVNRFVQSRRRRASHLSRAA